MREVQAKDFSSSVLGHLYVPGTVTGEAAQVDVPKPGNIFMMVISLRC
jgi:hypothetical protein